MIHICTCILGCSLTIGENNLSYKGKMRQENKVTIFPKFRLNIIMADKPMNDFTIVIADKGYSKIVYKIKIYCVITYYLFTYF